MCHPSGLLVESGRIVPQELLLRVRLEARPLQNVVHGVGELALRVGIVRGVHEDVVPEDAPDVVKHVLAFVLLDAAEEPSTGHVLAGSMLERGDAPDIDRLLVHTLGPEREPARAAFQDAHAQAGIPDRKSTRLNSSHRTISYAVFCLKKKKLECRRRWNYGFILSMVRDHPSLNLRPSTVTRRLNANAICAAASGGIVMCPPRSPGATW